MSSDNVDRDDPFGGVEFDGSFEGTRKRQMLLGLAMEPIERLEWLERTLAAMRALQGLARDPDEEASGGPARPAASVGPA